MRPRYEVRSAASPAEFRARVASAIADPNAICHGLVDDHKLELMARGEHHFWSPELRAYVEADGDGSRATGRFGPKPAVWTLFVAVYIHLAFAGVAGLVYAMAQLTLGRSPTALIAVPVALVVAVIVRFAVGVGQNLGADEMDLIRDFVDRAARRPSPSAAEEHGVEHPAGGVDRAELEAPVVGDQVHEVAHLQ